jgi:hypothetical protein
MGALLDWLITQPSRMWPDLLASVAAGDWRYAVEISEDEDGPDIVFVLEIQVDAGWTQVARLHRASLGLPRLANDSAHLLSQLGQQAPDDASELQE